MRDLDRYEKDYLDYPFESVLLHFRKKKLLAELPNLTDKSILEIGCGMDPLFSYLEHFLKYTLVEPGRDFYQHALSLAKESKDSNIFLNNCTLEKFITDEKFDVVILYGLLHEVQDPLGFVERVRSFVPSGGELFLNVPNALSMHRQIAKALGMIECVQEKSESNLRFQQASVFTPDEIKGLLRKCGFRIKKFDTCFLKPFTHSQLQKCLDLEILPSNIGEGLYGVSDLIGDYGAEIFVTASRIEA